MMRKEKEKEKGGKSKREITFKFFDDSFTKNKTC